MLSSKGKRIPTAAAGSPCDKTAADAPASAKARPDIKRISTAPKR